MEQPVSLRSVSRGDTEAEISQGQACLRAGKAGSRRGEAAAGVGEVRRADGSESLPDISAPTPQAQRHRDRQAQLQDVQGRAGSSSCGKSLASGRRHGVLSSSGSWLCEGRGGGPTSSRCKHFCSEIKTWDGVSRHCHGPRPRVK